MNSKDVMVVWTPNREPFESDGTKGRVAVTTIPEDPSTKGYTHSMGACDLGWDEMTDSERFASLRALAKQMIEEDNIEADVVFGELRKIDGFR